MKYNVGGGALGAAIALIVLVLACGWMFAHGFTWAFGLIAALAVARLT